MNEGDTPKGWVAALPSGEPDRRSLARLVDADSGRDEAENAYLEAVSDPAYVRLETEQRQFRGQYLRRLRRLASQKRPRQL